MVYFEENRILGLSVCWSAGSLNMEISVHVVKFTRGGRKSQSGSVTKGGKTGVRS